MKIPEKKKGEGAFEVKLFTKPFTVEQMSESDGTFSGKGMVFDSEHPTSSWQLGPEWKDRVRPGAFAETLAAHQAAGTKPLMLFMHERGNIPGAWTNVKESKGALQLSGQVSKNAVTPSGVPLLELMKMGAITGLSIGFKPTRVSLDEEKKLRDIYSVDLGEISIVDIPGSSTARITDVKQDRRGLEAALRTLGFSKSEAKAFIAGGFSELGGAEDDEAKGSYGGAHQTLVDRAARSSSAAKTLSSDAAARSAVANNESSHHKAMSSHEAAAHAHASAMVANRIAAHSATQEGDHAAAAGFSNAASEHDQKTKQHQEAARQHMAARDKASAGGDDYARDDHGRFTHKAGEDVEETLAMFTNAEMAKKESGHANKMSDDLRNGIHEAVHPGIKSAAHFVAAQSHGRAASFHAAAAKDEAQKVKTPGNKTVAQVSHERQAAEHSSQEKFHQSKADEYNRDDRGRFANTKAAGDVEESKAQWTAKFIDDLPDSAFLHVEAGGKKDADGKTAPRSLRHFPYKDGDGKTDLPHLRDAVGRIPQSDLPQATKDALATKAKKLLEDAKDGGADDSSEGPDGGKKSAKSTLHGIVAGIKESLSHRDDDGARRDAAGRTAKLILSFANEIKEATKG